MECCHVKKGGDIGIVCECMYVNDLVRFTVEHDMLMSRQGSVLKKADEEKLRVNEALEMLLSITEKSRNLRKDLKNDIHESVSTLRKAFNSICKQLDSVNEEYSSYRKEVNNTKNREATGGPNQTTEQEATSIDYTLQTRNNTQQIVTPTGGERGDYSEIVKNKDNNK